ncbi:Gibberellin cluster-C20-oxidase [Pleurostoma richardsiae]|uniref:Gibberellin cluster-C20-oxidase n=1 Tax=Pleurostoma richardsiae TaxID=41990 RepID=A0AA38VIL8_9PEZI|nr:Gibberellin cluster-C20-oxidase [Pleurostoma richardsiae]
MKRLFVTSSRELLAKARALYPKQPFRINTDLGEIVVLPPNFADEIRNEPRLSFAAAVYADFHGDIPGFEPSGLGGSADQLLQIVARKQLTKLLAKVTEPLSEEAAVALSVNLGESTEWREIRLKDALLDVVARLSSRVFLGNKLCRDDSWLTITKKYSVTMFIAATKLRMYPRASRKIVHWFLPECRQLRAELEESRRVVLPVIEDRRKAREAAAASGETIPYFDDALDWADQEAAAKGITYDPATFQLILSLAAIHTTTDLIEQVMLDLAQHPTLFQALRNEIVNVLRANGWKKTALYNMKLLDSVIKESQRMKPSSIVSMRRQVQGNLELSNGLSLKKGMRVAVDSCRLWDSSVYENPAEWDGYRFLKLRAQSGKENMAQLVATSADHLGFGHGEHACPGRFFAANEVKVALCHLLMKYDWKLVPGTDIQPVMSGTLANSSPTVRVLIQRRERVELDIDVI